MKRKTRVLLDCLRQLALPLFIFCIYSILIAFVFWLYDLKLEPFFYAGAVCFFVLICAFVIEFFKESKAADLREHQLNNILCEWNSFEQPRNLTKEDYQQMIKALGEKIEKLTADFSEEQKETQDFYTTWVHQIKTPIAVLKLELDKTNTSELDRAALQEELFRIEQYTDMVLSYQRLGSTSNDLVVKEYSLDELIREVIRKYASQFIHKKLKLEYEGCSEIIVIDKKWFCCILEQLISNAIKYTQVGTISITVAGGEICVSDTGIGIAPEDLPRIFEKGYTGTNGRLNGKSSGLGLYLCSKAAALLGVPIKAQSTPARGSSFSLDIRGKII